jgi:hypothetical protein
MARKHTGPKRRNTLTLDDDNAIRLERLRKERDLSFKDAVNDVIRRGLNEAEKPFRPAAPFETKVFHGAKANFRTPEELKALIEQIELEDDLRKLGRR